MHHQVRYNNLLKPIAKQLRNNATIYEKILWDKLRKRRMQNVKFYRQVPIGNFIVDFYAKTLRLVIEVDGEYHLAKDMQEKDFNRDYYLASVGIYVLRFSNRDVQFNLDKIVKEINSTVIKLLTN